MLGERIIISALILPFIIFLSLTISEARSYRVMVLPEKARALSCQNCHLDPRGGGARNHFGKDYERLAIPAREKLTPELLSLDSDGDGKNNEEELNAGTNPGDKSSRP